MSHRKFSLAVILIAGLLAYGATNYASTDVSARSILGTYGFSGSGTLGAGTIQAAVVGLTTFAPNGRCRITAKINAVPLVPQPVSVHSTSCSYTLNADGTGTQDITFDHPIFAGPFHSDLVVVDNGEEIPFMLSDESGGTVATGLAKQRASDQ